MKKLLSIILSITMLLSMATVAFADGIDGPMQKAKITVGINAEFAPFEYYDENGKLTGFDVDLMNYIGERISYDIDYVEMSFDKLIPAVVNGEVDCAISGITITKERESVIDYTTPYLVAQSEVDGKIQYEEYAIVFPDNSIQKAKLAEASGHEFIYTLVNDAVNELIEDATVEKLIQKYELNENAKETGYSYSVLDSRYSEFIDAEAVPTSPYKSILYNYDKVETATKVGDILNFKAENVSEFHLAKVNEEQFTVGVIISDPDDIKKFYNEFVALKFTDNSDVEDAITILMRVKIDDELHIGDYYTHYGLFSGAYGEDAETIEGLYISEQELYKIVEEMGYEWTLNIAGAGPTVSGDTASVPLSDWAKDSVIKATDLGIMEAGKKYDFLKPITREEFCELIYNYCANVLEMLSTADGKKFTDTDNPKIEILSAMGIINGKTATEFAPNDALTREEAAVILQRMVNATVPVAVTEMWFEFDDIDYISDWALDAVQTMCNMNVMNGVGGNEFAPKEVYTTEQAIVTITRVYSAQTAQYREDIGNEEPIGTIIGGADAPTQIVVTDTIEIDDFYVNEAIKLVTESGKLAGDKAFISLYTTNDEMTDKILALSTVDFNKPTDIYYLSADREQIYANIEALAKADGVDIDNLGEHWFEHILKKLNFSTLASMINASYGAENLAALTILTNSRGYIMPKDFKNNFALFVQYEGNYSAIVSFSEFGDGVISANMSFVKNGDKDNVFMRMYEITSTVGEDGFKIAKVEL